MDHDNPLVTFVVLTYNQFSFIPEALAGAFSQDYSPLEILISDDCSTDGSFELIQKIAESYQGPHRIQINRNISNLGIGGNTRRAFELANGEILIWSGGDDISRPTRTSRIIDAFRANPGATAVCSRYSEISDEGAFLRGNVGSLSHRYRLPKISQALACSNGGGYGLGSTYAYRKEVGFWPEPFPDNTINEDRLLPLRALFLGEIEIIPEDLLDYRLSHKGLSRAIAFSEMKGSLRPSHMKHVYHTINSAYKERRISFFQHWALKTIGKLGTAKFRCYAAKKKTLWIKCKTRLAEQLLAKTLLLYYLMINPFGFYQWFRK